MEQKKEQTRMFLLMILLAVWLGAFGYSFFILLMTEPVGDGFTRGLNRAAGFFGWQGVAWVLAVGCWGIGRSFAKGSGIRRISIVPLIVAFGIVLVMIGIMIFSVVRSPGG